MFKRKVNDENEAPINDENGEIKKRLLKSNSKNVLIDSHRLNENNKSNQITNVINTESGKITTTTDDECKIEIEATECKVKEEENGDHYDDDIQDYENDYGDLWTTNIVKWFYHKVEKRDIEEYAISDEEVYISDNNVDGVKNDKWTEVTKQQASIIKNIQLQLRRVNSSLKESLGGVADELPVLPGLFIKLPLNEKNRDDLIEIGVEKLFDFKRENLDSEIMKPIQIEPSSIEIKNTEWDLSLRKLVDRVADGLGCNGTVGVKLHKLFVYGKGDPFRSHDYKEKDEKAFATLIVQLPSVCEGGELVVHNKDGTKCTFDFGQSTSKSLYSTQFVAHYSDLECELLEIKSGYRLWLVYSLFWECRAFNNRAKRYNISDNLIKCFQILNNTDFKFGITLSNEYTPSEIKQNGIGALKGDDLNIFDVLKHVNERLPREKRLSFYIVQTKLRVSNVDWDHSEMEREFEEPNCGFEKDNDCEHKFEFYDLNGVVCFENFDTQNIVNQIIDVNNKEMLFCDMADPSSYGKTRHVHINGHITDYTYGRHVLIMWPKFNEYRKFLEINDEYAVDVMYASINSDLNDFNEYSNCLKTIITNFKESKRSIGKLQSVKIMGLIEKFNDFDLLKDFLKNVKMVYHPRKLAALIIKYSWEALESYAKKLLLPVTMKKIFANCELVQELYNLGRTDYAFECFKYFVVPILDQKYDVNEHKNIFDFLINKEENIDADFKKKIAATLLKLIETITLFDDKSIKKYSTSYTQLVGIGIGVELHEWLNFLERLSRKTKLIQFLSYDCLFNDFLKELTSSDIKKLFMNLQIVKLLWDCSQFETSKNWFDRFVLGVLESGQFESKMSNTLMVAYHGIDQATVYNRLVDTVFLLKHECFEEIREKFTLFTSINKDDVFSLLFGMFSRASKKSNLVKIFKFEILFKIMQEMVHLNPIQSLSRICDIVTILFDMNQTEIVNRCLHDLLFVILEKPEVFEKANEEERVEELFKRYSYIKYESNKKKEPSAYEKLTDLILLLKNETLNEKFYYFIKKISETDQSQNIFSDLFKCFKNNENYVINSPSILNLLEFRKSYLKKQLETTDTNFTWCMQGKVPSHPKFEEFLKSKDQEFTYRGVFCKSSEGDNFINTYSGEKDNLYSVHMGLEGRGTKTRVIIQKTNAYHKQKLERLELFANEIKEIECILQQKCKID